MSEFVELSEKPIGQARWRAWAPLGLGLLLWVAMLVLQASGCGTLVDPSSPVPPDRYAEVTITLTGVAFLVLGTIILRRWGENRIGWLYSLIGLSILVMSFTIEYPHCGYVGGNASAWIGNAIVLVPVYMMFVLLPLWFPNGQFLSAGWRWLAVVSGLLLAVTVVVSAVWPGPLVILENMGAGLFANPLALPFTPPPNIDQLIRRLPSLILVAAAIPANASLFARWRGSSGDTRLQIKWLAYFVVTVGVFFLLVELLGGLFFPQIFNTWFYLAALTAAWLGYPLIIGIAVLKYRLYDIDLIIRRTLLYSSLTMILGVLYAVAVVMLQQVMNLLPSGSDRSQITVVISTLATAALFNPLRARLQTWIDRRYYRDRIDSEQVLTRMGAALRNEVDLDRVSSILLNSVDEALHPANAALWVRKERGS